MNSSDNYLSDSSMDSSNDDNEFYQNLFESAPVNLPRNWMLKSDIKIQNQEVKPEKNYLKI